MKKNEFRKRHIISYTLSLATLIGVLGGCARKEIANFDSLGKNIICFGDSITAGYGVNPGEDYPSALAKLLDTPVINSGNSGETSQEAVKRIQDDVLSKEPLLVIVEFGGNDFLEKLPLEKTVNNLKQIIEKIQASGAMVAIADVSSSMVMGSYRREFKKLSKEYKAIFIPKLLSGILTTPSLKSDFIHPNAEGYRIIAQRVLRVITPYLKRGNSGE